MTFIIDSHAHFGGYGKKNLDPDTLLRAMDKYRIDFALVSNLCGCEYDNYHRPIEGCLSEREVNQATLELVRKHPDRFRGLYWVMPSRQGFTPDAELFLNEHRAEFAGMKAHPYYSALPVTEPAYEPYFAMSLRLELPWAIHSAWDEYSRPEYIVDLARRFPVLDFVMVHLGLFTDNREAVDLVSGIPNLYGDCTWIREDGFRYALENLPADKLMFGTDAVIDGVDTYRKYDFVFREIEKQDKEKQDGFFYRNAAKVFRLGEVLKIF